MNPIIPVFTTGKVALSKDDTATLLAAIIAITPLPAGKTVSDIRSYSIAVAKPAGTSNVSIQFN